MRNLEAMNPPAAPPTERAAGPLGQFAAAWTLLSRLPWPFAVPRDPGAIGRGVWAFPIVGALLGGLGGGAYWLGREAGLPALVAAALAIGFLAFATGALHEDGLADTADGFGGGRTREQKLAIMRDSRIGTFGALAIVFGIGIRAAILSGLSSPDVAALAIIAAAVVSRATLPAVMRWQSPARADGLSAAAGVPAYRQVMAAAALALAIAFVTVGFWAGFAVCIAAGLAALCIAAAAERTLGGHTGDVLGAVQVASELAVLVAIAAIE